MRRSSPCRSQGLRSSVRNTHYVNFALLPQGSCPVVPAAYGVLTRHAPRRRSAPSRRPAIGNGHSKRVDSPGKIFPKPDHSGTVPSEPDKPRPSPAGLRFAPCLDLSVSCGPLPTWTAPGKIPRDEACQKTDKRGSASASISPSKVPHVLSGSRKAACAGKGS